MKISKIFKTIGAAVMALSIIGTIPMETYAKKHSNSRRSTTTKTSKKSSETIRIEFRKHCPFVYYLYPNGTCYEYWINYKNEELPVDYITNKPAVYKWKKDYRLIGNNQREYYYEIMADGNQYYITTTYPYKVYLGYSNFCSDRDGKNCKISTVQ